MDLTTAIIVLSIGLRIGFFVFGVYQDKYLTVKYTDIDYLVFSDAANYVYNHQSPYLRETYRYTPLLAWLLIPNSFGGIWYNFGKLIFIICDIITGYIILQLLRIKTTNQKKIFALSSIWLMNPMVITISTRGSAESVLTVLIMLAIYYCYRQKFIYSAIWLGISIHFKIYPIIYLPSILLYLQKFGSPLINKPILKLVNRTNIIYLAITLVTVLVLNLIMYGIYGFEFLNHSYIYHFTRLDHRHNFSVYNILLYYKSSLQTRQHGLINNIEQYAFIPQLFLSGVLMPLKFASTDLGSCLFMQTFAFVTFNKVITSQYFLWFMILLPHFLSSSSLIGSNYKTGILCLIMWVASQGIWLGYAYKLEFLGENTFDGGLLMSSCFFFLSNCWILGVFIADMP